MTTYGVTPTGFVKKPLDVIKTEIEAALRASLGDKLNLLPTSVFGQMIGIFSDRVAEVWDVQEAVYNSQYPGTAGGQSLDHVSAFTGTTRLPATKSTVTLTCNLNAGVTLPAGRVVSHGEGSTVRFVTIAAVTNSGGSPANVDVAAEAEVTGPTVALAGTLTTIETPVTGWNSATNALDAVPGRNIESDAALRLRREQLLRITGNASLDAIISAVADLDGVTSVTGFMNNSDVTDVDGIPPHSVEILALGGAQQDILDAIWRSIGGGIGSHGNVAGTATDIKGGTHAVKFTRPVEVPIYAIIDVTTNSDFPTDGVDQAKAAVVARGDAQGQIGGDVVTEALKPAVWSVPGVVDITKFWVGTSNPPTGPINIPISSRQFAVWDTSRITVNAT